jgi:EAL domain-containing protein (putative c-di-GMP-specific phosphodiesterase class I)
MSYSNDEPILEPRHASDSEGPPRPVERRRAGRLNAVSPNLLSILRNPTGDAMFAPAEALPETTSEAASLRRLKACKACRKGTDIFPFTMAFQPIVDLQENRIDAYEALVRGPAGEGAGFVLGQVTPENIYAFDQACRVKAISMAARLGIDRQLSINFLPNAVYQAETCIQLTLREAARTGFPRNRLTFEILESEALIDTTHLMAIIVEYRKHGFKIALDDFGSGYSGLVRLAQLRPDIIKVDRELIVDCEKDSGRLAIVASLIKLGAELGVKVVVEGVDQAAQVYALMSAGARFFQGFYFAKPGFERIAQESEITWPHPQAAWGAAPMV